MAHGRKVRLQDVMNYLKLETAGQVGCSRDSHCRRGLYIQLIPSEARQMKVGLHSRGDIHTGDRRFLPDMVTLQPSTEIYANRVDSSASFLQIILVDDASTRDYLMEPFDRYLRLLPKVRVLRNTQRNGLIRSRLRGFDEAKGDVVIFLVSNSDAT